MLLLAVVQGLADADQALGLLGAQAERDAEVRVRVAVEGDDFEALARDEPGDHAGGGRLAGPALADDGDLHAAPLVATTCSRVAARPSTAAMAGEAGAASSGARPARSAAASSSSNGMAPIRGRFVPCAIS